jgi:hypothetical protein
MGKVTEFKRRTVGLEVFIVDDAAIFNPEVCASLYFKVSSNGIFSRKDAKPQSLFDGGQG